MMKKQPWWTQLARLTTAAALTSLIAGGVTCAVLTASNQFNTLGEALPPISVAEAHTAAELAELSFTSKPASSSTHFQLQLGGISLQASQAVQQPTINEAVQYYKARLAKDKPFEAWRQAMTELLPLGPGMHGWLVRIMDYDTQIGYMILQTTDKGEIRLEEYGQGDSMPYDEAILQEAITDMLQSGELGTKMASDVQPLFLQPLFTVWRVDWQDGTASWLDAQSGEWLPEQFNPDLKTESAPVMDNHYSGSAQIAHRPNAPQPFASLLHARELLPEHTNRINQSTPLPSRLRMPFDPYGNILWMAEHSHKRLTGKIPDNFQSERWIYVQQDASKSVNQPYSLIGVQQWQQTASISLSSEESLAANAYIVVNSADMKTLRWIAADAALQHGSFVPQS